LFGRLWDTPHLLPCLPHIHLFMTQTLEISRKHKHIAAVLLNSFS